MSTTIQLKVIRELKNFSQSYVADKMGITQSYYSRLESGSSKLTAELLDRAIAALEVKQLHPIFKAQNDVLETLDQQQLEFNEFQQRIMKLEIKIVKLEIEIGKLKKVRNLEKS